MPLHDAYARRTPFELVFPDEERTDTLVAAVAEEARAGGGDPGNPNAFVTMGAVGGFLREIQGPDAPPEAIHHYGALVFHGVHFARAGCPLYLLSTEVARALVAAAPEAPASVPHSAGYLQLPQHLFWVDVSASGPPESVDGIFWTAPDDAQLHAMLVTGLRPDRPGVGVVPLPEAPLSDAADWMDAVMRDGGNDFESALPGGDLDRLYSIQSAGEALKLLARFFAYVAAHGNGEPVEPGPIRRASADAADADAADADAADADAADDEAAGDGAAGARAAGAADGPGSDAAPGDPAPSRLAFRRIAADG